MTSNISGTGRLPSLDNKIMPDTEEVRAAIRNSAQVVVLGMSRTTAPNRETLENCAAELLTQLGMPVIYIGYAMVAISNCFWAGQFAAVPYKRRLLLLPHCLSNADLCVGSYDSVGLNCASCGACNINEYRTRAEKLSYQVIISEGTSSAMMKVIDGSADAILGVACLDSLEKSFARIVDLGIPNIAVPLLQDGCVNTEADAREITRYLEMFTDQQVTGTNSYLPLLRAASDLFSKEQFSILAGGCTVAGNTDDALTNTERIACDWLRYGGKRLRPFVTLATYAVARQGREALASDAQVDKMLPTSIKRLALAIEVMHKASLIHDDIEDSDNYRYGRATLHSAYDVPTAINAGDYLVGMGYQLIANEGNTLGASCTGDIIRAFSSAHLALTRGQGAELHWRQSNTLEIKPLEMLSMYALKTAPAFEVALYTGLRAAEIDIDLNMLKRYAMYLGEGFQALNDLDDWRDNAQNKVERGLDALADRPTIMRAFAIEAHAGEELASLLAMRDEAPAGEVVERIRRLYTELGVFTRTEKLVEKLRARALNQAESLPDDGLRELFAVLVRIVLPTSTAQGT